MGDIEREEGEPALGPRAARLLAASREPGCRVSFCAGRPGPATADAAERAAVESGELSLSFAALSAIACGAEEIERQIADWSAARAVNPAEEAACLSFWRAQLPFIGQDGAVDDRAYLDALAAAALSPAPQAESGRTPQERVDALKRAADPAWRDEQLSRATARRAPSELADSLLRAEGQGGIMPPPARRELLPDRSEILAGALAGEPAWLWAKQARREASPEPLAPPLWESAPAFAAATWRRLAAAFSAACEDGAEGVPGWAQGAAAWAAKQRGLWAGARFDPAHAWEAALSVGRAAAEAAARGEGCADGLSAEALTALEGPRGREDLARCIASAMCAALARGMPKAMRARAPDAAAPHPLTPERMTMLAGANPAKPWF